MKNIIAAVAIAVASIGSATAKASTPEAPRVAEFVVCDYGPTVLRLTCWDSSKTAVYRAVPFDQVFNEGWQLIQAYSVGYEHYWVLQRPLPSTAG